MFSVIKAKGDGMIAWNFFFLARLCGQRYLLGHQYAWHICSHQVIKCASSHTTLIFSQLLHSLASRVPSVCQCESTICLWYVKRMSRAYCHNQKKREFYWNSYFYSTKSDVPFVKAPHQAYKLYLCLYILYSINVGFLYSKSKHLAKLIVNPGTFLEKASQADIPAGGTTRTLQEMQSGPVHCSSWLCSSSEECFLSYHFCWV